MSLINNYLIAFDNSKIFSQISIKEFAKYKETVNLFGKEINNIYLYIYFKKNGIYNEYAFKSIIESDDDFM